MISSSMPPMRHTVKFFACIFLGCVCLQHGEGPPTVGIYLDFTDSGDAKMSSFIATIAPYPFFYVPPLTLWLGGQLSVTQAAQELIQNQNMTVVDFMHKLQYVFFIDEPAWAGRQLSFLHKYNNSLACQYGGDVIDLEICNAIFTTMKTAASNVSMLIPVDFQLNDRIWFWPLLDWIFNDLGINFRARFKLILEETSLICVQLDLKTREIKQQYNPSQLARRNFENVFSTKKYITGENITRRCPPNSIEIDADNCLCMDQNHSGPFCQLQCNYTQVDPLNIWCNGKDGDKCKFSESDYGLWCLKNRTIPVMDGKLIAEPISLKQIDISWKLQNYFTMESYQYEIIVQSSAGSLGTMEDCMSYFSGMTNNISLTKICPKDVVSDFVGCVVKSYWPQNVLDQCKCQFLELKPYTDYKVTLKLMPGSTVEMIEDVYVLAGSANFTSPEIVPPQPPLITGIAFTSRNELLVNWIVPRYCPGKIRDYHAEISCGNFVQSSSEVLSYDCRQNNDTQQINLTLSDRCVQHDFSMKMTIATSKGPSQWSKAYNVSATSSGWSMAVIIAVACGAFTTALILGIIVFVYYYKRHVQIYQNVYQTLQHLLNNRKSGSGQSFRQPIKFDRTLPACPEVVSSSSDTTFQPTPILLSPRFVDDLPINSQVLSSMSPATSVARFVNASTQTNWKSLHKEDSFGYKLMVI